MPSLRIPFPEKDTPSLVALRALRITVGRLPDNTIQIRDRTISAHHAELIDEGDHYRLHDLGATNGVLVNGQPVTDFHLSEGCQVTFGGVECEFNLEMPEEETLDPSQALVSRAEADVLARENADLKTQVATFRQEIEALQRAHAASNGAATVPQTEFDRVTTELAALKLQLDEHERVLEQWKADQAVLRRDRENLQRALNEAKSTPASAGPAAAPVTTESETPDEAPAASRVPAATVPAPVGKPFSLPGTVGAQPPTKPFAPATPQSPAPLQPVAGAPAVAGSGLRPAAFAKPAVAARPGVPASQAAKPGMPLTTQPRVVGTAVKPGTPLPKPAGVAVGPKGTQKISV
jgi:pSer/pThr/pTyr-binding forkhead associated (FHA) protein